jgi:protein-L-isoaspartate O-methyltransferase
MWRHGRGLGRQFTTAHARHDHVSQQHVDALSLLRQQVEGLGAIARRQDAEPLQGENLPDQGADLLVIIGDQDGANPAFTTIGSFGCIHRAAGTIPHPSPGRNPWLERRPWAAGRRAGGDDARTQNAGVIEPQRKLLGDQVRNRAFAEAIRRAVQPGRTRVADLGTGTGYLAILAERAGARSVWAMDAHAGVVRLARQVAKDNACTRIRFAVGHSTALAPPGPVDLVIAEILGNLAGEEHLVEALVDAQRWLAPGGRMIPGRVSQWLCPVTGDAVQRSVDVLADKTVKLAAVRRLSLNNVYVRTHDPRQLLAGGTAGQAVDEISFPGEVASRRRSTASWELPPGAVHGLCLWWEAELVPGVVLSTSPLAEPTHWEQIYLPLEQPLHAHAGDRLEVELASDTRWDAGCIVAWKGRLLRRGKAVASFALDNLTGFIG